MLGKLPWCQAFPEKKGSHQRKGLQRKEAHIKVTECVFFGIHTDASMDHMVVPDSPHITSRTPTRLQYNTLWLVALPDKRCNYRALPRTCLEGTHYSGSLWNRSACFLDAPPPFYLAHAGQLPLARHTVQPSEWSVPRRPRGHLPFSGWNTATYLRRQI